MNDDVERLLAEATPLPMRDFIDVLVALHGALFEASQKGGLPAYACLNMAHVLKKSIEGARLPAYEAAVEKAKPALSLARSMILSGEPMSENAATVFEEAFTALARLRETVPA